MGPLRSGPMCGTDELGQYKTPDMPGFAHAQRGRARSALLWRVFIYIWNEIGIGRELIMADIWILVLFKCFQSERSNWPSHAHIVHIKTYTQSFSIFSYIYFESIEKANKIKCK